MLINLVATGHWWYLFTDRVTREDYAVTSQQLNEAGYATFRYDMRGLGEFGRHFVEASAPNSIVRINLLAADAAAAVLVLSNKKRINKQGIVVMEGSQASPSGTQFVPLSAACVMSLIVVSIQYAIVIQSFPGFIVFGCINLF